MKVVPRCPHCNKELAVGDVNLAAVVDLEYWYLKCQRCGGASKPTWELEPDGMAVRVTPYEPNCP